MADNPKRKFKITATYFKDTGKLYASGECELEVQDIGSKDGRPPQCYMNEVVEHFRDLLLLADLGTGVADLGGKPETIPMPGLSGVWRDFIVVDCPEHGFPCLITPKWVEQERYRRYCEEEWKRKGELPEPIPPRQGLIEAYARLRGIVAHHDAENSTSHTIEYNGLARRLAERMSGVELEADVKALAHQVKLLEDADAEDRED